MKVAGSIVGPMLRERSVRHIRNVLTHGFGLTMNKVTRRRSRRRSPFSFQLCDNSLEPRTLLNADASSLSAGWLGQDERDLVGPSAQPGGSDVQDIHIQIDGLDPDRDVQTIRLQGFGGSAWQYEAEGLGPHWRAELIRDLGSSTGDLFVEPDRFETGRQFQLALTYEDDTTHEIYFEGGEADPNLRMPGAIVELAWIGQTGRDEVGLGPAVGPDGFQDVEIRLSGLSALTTVESIGLSGPPGIEWQFGLNRAGHSNAELVLDPDQPGQGTLFIQPDRDLSNFPLTLQLLYANGSRDAGQVVAQTSNPAKPTPRPSLPTIDNQTLELDFLGQDGSDASEPGAIRLAVADLPEDAAIVEATLTDGIDSSWHWTPVDSTDRFARLELEHHDVAPDTAALRFVSRHNLEGLTLHLLVTLDDGRRFIADVEASATDPSAILPDTRDDRGSVVAQPGDDLQDLVDQFGVVELSAGTYRLDQPLVLNKSTTLVGEPGAVLSFSQSSTSPAWTTAIKVMASHTRLESFDVRFEGPIRWNQAVGFGPAVIGSIDNFDPGYSGRTEPIVDLNVLNLDIEGPPSSGTQDWEQTPRLMRLVTASSGRIEGNTLRGGMTELAGGPWTFVDNTHTGTPIGTSTPAVLSVGRPRDLLVEGNTASSEGPSGKTWRFLVLTQEGEGISVVGNTIRDVGPRDDDVIPSANAPEVILTESYRVHFEGRIRRSSPDRMLIQVDVVQGSPVEVGSVVSVLNGPSAGQWRRVVQVIDESTFLLNAPLPDWRPDVVISSGFVDSEYVNNAIDVTGSSTTRPINLLGNQWDSRVVGNRLIGGDDALFLTAMPTEAPRVWGWSRVPMFDLLVQGNEWVDSLKGGTFDVFHGGVSKSTEGRLYATGSIVDNTIVWTQSFLDSLNPSVEPVALTLGHQASLDPTEIHVQAAGNVLVLPADADPSASLMIPSATVNGEVLTDTVRSLPILSTETPKALELINDSGIDGNDRVTNDARVRFDGTQGTDYEYRLIGESDNNYRPVPDPNSFEPVGLVEGVNTVLVRATGSGLPTALTFTYDTVAPNPNAPDLRTDADSGISTTDDVTKRQILRFEADFPTDAIEIALVSDGDVLDRRSVPKPLRDRGSIVEGPNVYEVHASDRAGNTGISDPLTVIRDREGPSAVTNLRSLNDGTVEFDPVSEAIAYHYRVLNSPETSEWIAIGEATSFRLADLGPGTYDVAVRAEDLAGNLGVRQDIAVTFPSSGVELSGLWYGLDSRSDRVGPSTDPGADGRADTRIDVLGLPTDHGAIVSAELVGLGAGRWAFGDPDGPWWYLDVVTSSSSDAASVFFEPGDDFDTDRQFWIVITYSDGTTVDLWVQGEPGSDD